MSYIIKKQQISRTENHRFRTIIELLTMDIKDFDKW